MGKTYTTVQGDTWDLVSLAAYGNEKYVDILMQRNFPLLDYSVFPSGVVIAIPDLPERDENEYPDWRTMDE